MSERLRAAAALLDAAPDLPVPSVSCHPESTEISLQLAEHEGDSLPAWSALLTDPAPVVAKRLAFSKSGSGYRSVTGTYDGQPVEVWASASNLPDDAEENS